MDVKTETHASMGSFRDHPLWQVSKKLALDPARRLAVKAAYPNRVPLMWLEGRNWGDALSPVLVEWLSGKRALHLEGLHHRRYMVIGSILGAANERAEIWGSGFIRENAKLIGRPRVVHAVRGPLTREGLVRQGVECPEIYGDPALLLPRFFNPVVEKEYAVGIVPHYVDKGHPWLEAYGLDPQVKVVDIEAGIEDFVRDIQSCDVILSSSLHGLICADSYGIPNAWIQFSEEVIGGGFKFRDYRASIDAEEPNALIIRSHTPLDALISKVAKHDLKIDLRKLLLACPFLSTELQAEVQHALPGPCGLPLAFQSVPPTSSAQNA